MVEGQAAFQCSIGPDTETNGGKNIKCPECNQIATSWTAIVNHYEKKHDYSQESMVSHYIFNQAVEEHINKTNPTISQEEWDALEPGSDVWSFHCKSCDKELSKRSAALHFKKRHPEEFTEGAVKEWVVVKDAKACGHGRLTKCILSKLYEEHAQREGEQAFPQDELGAAQMEQQIVEPENEDVAMAAANVLAPKPKSLPSSHKGPLHDALQGIHQRLDAMLEAKTLEVPLPNVTVRDVLFEWERPVVEKLRHNCPIPKTAAQWNRFDFKDFDKYLKLNTDQNNQSRNFTILSMKRFYWLLDIEEGDHVEPVGTICAIYQKDVFQQVQEAPSFDNQYTWCRDITAALVHYTKHLMQVCNKNKWVEANATLKQFIDECLTGTKKKDLKAKKTSSGYKKLRDAERLLVFPDKEIIKQEVKTAMKTIHAIHKHAQDELLEELPSDMRLEALTEIVGIIFYNSVAGRSGEWGRFKAKHVKEQKQKGANHLLAQKHKTSSTWGALAKYIPAGSWEAFELFMSLPGKKTDLFLEPFSEKDIANLAGLLKRFGFKHFKNGDPPNSNLIRKMFHSALLRISREEDAMKFFEIVDAHSRNVARQVYTIATAEDDANLAHRLFLEVLGDHVDFPWDEIDQDVETIDEILAKGNLSNFNAEDVEKETNDEVSEDIFLMLVPLEGAPPTSHEIFWDNLAFAIPIGEAGDEPLQDMEDEDLEPLQDMDDAGVEIGAAELQPIVEPQPKRAKYAATPAEKAYLDTKAIKDADGKLVYPVKKEITTILEEGQSNGSLNPYMTYDGVKSYLRKKVYVAQQGAPVQGEDEHN